MMSIALQNASGPDGCDTKTTLLSTPGTVAKALQLLDHRFSEEEKALNRKRPNGADHSGGDEEAEMEPKPKRAPINWAIPSEDDCDLEDSTKKEAVGVSQDAIRRNTNLGVLCSPSSGPNNRRAAAASSTSPPAAPATINAGGKAAAIARLQELLLQQQQQNWPVADAAPVVPPTPPASIPPPPLPVPVDDAILPPIPATQPSDATTVVLDSGTVPMQNCAPAWFEHPRYGSLAPTPIQIPQYDARQEQLGPPYSVPPSAVPFGCVPFQRQQQMVVPEAAILSPRHCQDIVASGSGFAWPPPPSSCFVQPTTSIPNTTLPLTLSQEDTAQLATITANIQTISANAKKRKIPKGNARCASKSLSDYLTPAKNTDGTEESQKGGIGGAKSIERRSRLQVRLAKADEYERQAKIAYQHCMIFKLRALGEQRFAIQLADALRSNSKLPPTPEALDAPLSFGKSRNGVYGTEVPNMMLIDPPMPAFVEFAQQQPPQPQFSYPGASIFGPFVGPPCDQQPNFSSLTAAANDCPSSSYPNNIDPSLFFSSTPPLYGSESDRQIQNPTYPPVQQQQQVPSYDAVAAMSQPQWPSSACFATQDPQTSLPLPLSSPSSFAPQSQQPSTVASEGKKAAPRQRKSPSQRRQRQTKNPNGTVAHRRDQQPPAGQTPPFSELDLANFIAETGSNPVAVLGSTPNVVFPTRNGPDPFGPDDDNEEEGANNRFHHHQ